MSGQPISEAAALLSKGFVKEALAILKDQSAEDAHVLFLIGVANFRLKNYAKAKDRLRRSILRDASRADCHYYLGLCAERQGHFEEAQQSYRTALAINPTLEQARSKLQQSDGTEATQKQLLKSRESELFLPENDAEFTSYEQRRRRKEIIDAFAQRDAAWTVTLDSLSRVSDFLDKTVPQPLASEAWSSIEVDLRSGEVRLSVRHLQAHWFKARDATWASWLRELGTSILK